LRLMRARRRLIGEVGWFLWFAVWIGVVYGV
jgi:hypothetical protein